MFKKNTLTLKMVEERDAEDLLNILDLLNSKNTSWSTVVHV
jgi:hypothetical protein